LCSAEDAETTEKGTNAHALFSGLGTNLPHELQIKMGYDPLDIIKALSYDIKNRVEIISPP